MPPSTSVVRRVPPVAARRDLCLWSGGRHRSASTPTCGTRLRSTLPVPRGRTREGGGRTDERGKDLLSSSFILLPSQSPPPPPSPGVPGEGARANPSYHGRPRPCLPRDSSHTGEPPVVRAIRAVGPPPVVTYNPTDDHAGTNARHGLACQPVPPANEKLG
jgi:hypothetical protein